MRPEDADESPPGEQSLESPVPPSDTAAGGGGKPPSDTNDLGPGEFADEPSGMPSTPNDVKWEAWHNGTIEIVGEPSASDAEILKIYHPNPDESPYRPFTVVTPGGHEVAISSGSIVQVYHTDESGRVSAAPDVVFQGDQELPEDFSISYHPHPDMLPDAGGSQVTISTGDAIEYEPLPLPGVGRAEDPDPLLQALSRAARIFDDQTPRYPMFDTGNPHERVVQYPMLGRRMNVVLPNGRLIHGHSRDLIEIVTRTPDFGYERLRVVTLATLAKEPRYMEL
jgi:hypothetical protein